MIRVGVINPHDMALDAELWRWAPEGVSLHCTRLPPHGATVDLAMVESLADPGELTAAVHSIATVRPNAYAYACTSGSFVGGLAGERRIVAAITAAGHAPAITTSGALLAELERAGVRSLAVATPYQAAISDRLADFLAEAGFGVVRSRGLGLTEGIAEVPAKATAELVRAADHPEAELIFISCTNLPTHGLLDQLSDALGKSVISANQVTIAAAVRVAGASVGRDG